MAPSRRTGAVFVTLASLVAASVIFAVRREGTEKVKVKAVGSELSRGSTEPFGENPSSRPDEEAAGAGGSSTSTASSRPVRYTTTTTARPTTTIARPW